MEKAAQTPNGAPHRRRRRRPAGNGSAPHSENAPRANGSHPRRGQGRPAQPQSQQAPRQNAPAQRPAAPQNAPQGARPAAPQPPRRNARPAPQVPSQPLRDQPKAPRPPRNARAPRSTAPEQPGLDLISRRPPKQKFANFEDYLAAHGGMTVPLPPEASDAADTPETVNPAEAAE